MAEGNNDFPWVIFSLKGSLFAVTARDVRSMSAMPPVVKMPLAPSYVRGVVNLRDRVVPVIDLRARLGMTSFPEEVEAFCGMMRQREQDHKNWLVELKNSLKEDREFKLATDPHQCAFGKWYDNFRPASHVLAALVKKFEAPHGRIHAIAVQVKELVEHGEREAAHQIIDRCRDNELAEMIRLFAAIRKAYVECSREICMVFSLNSRQFAFAVDSIESVEKLTENGFEDIPDVLQENGNGNENGLIYAAGRRARDSSLVLLLDHARAVADLGSNPTQQAT